MGLAQFEKDVIKDFIAWYEFSGHDAFEMFDNPDEIMEEFLTWKHSK